VVVIPPEGNMADYIGSLRAAQALKPVAILPGHGPVIEQPVDFLQAYIDHRLKREEEIFQWTRRGVTDAHSIAAHIYGDRPEVRRVAMLQVTAHLQKLKQEGRL
jgi:glyoxylase-like metal-dependent hydrolase (beta-lactamase superfamily II)